jgi:hypothetical protein
MRFRGPVTIDAWNKRVNVDGKLSLSCLRSHKLTLSFSVCRTPHPILFTLKQHF